MPATVLVHCRVDTEGVLVGKVAEVGVMGASAAEAMREVGSGVETGARACQRREGHAGMQIPLQLPR